MGSAGRGAFFTSGIIQGRNDSTRGMPPTFSFPPLRVGKENVDEKKMLREADTFWSSKRKRSFRCSGDVVSENFLGAKRSGAEKKVAGNVDYTKKSNERDGALRTMSCGRERRVHQNLT